MCVCLCVCDLMRWTVLGGACVTPSALVTVKMINSVKILQQLITAKQQIFNHLVTYTTANSAIFSPCSSY